MSRDYGVLLEDEGIALRGLFIIDPKGTLRQITVNDLPVGRSVDETIRLIKAFQFTVRVPSSLASWLRRGCASANGAGRTSSVRCARPTGRRAQRPSRRTRRASSSTSRTRRTSLRSTRRRCASTERHTISALLPTSRAWYAHVYLHRLYIMGASTQVRPRVSETNHFFRYGRFPQRCLDAYAAQRWMSSRSRRRSTV
jgi:hypothetical protein